MLRSVEKNKCFVFSKVYYTRFVLYVFLKMQNQTFYYYSYNNFGVVNSGSRDVQLFFSEA